MSHTKRWQVMFYEWLLLFFTTFSAQHYGAVSQALSAQQLLMFNWRLFDWSAVVARRTRTHCIDWLQLSEPVSIASLASCPSLRSPLGPHSGTSTGRPATELSTPFDPRPLTNGVQLGRKLVCSWGGQLTWRTYGNGLHRRALSSAAAAAAAAAAGLSVW